MKLAPIPLIAALLWVGCASPPVDEPNFLEKAIAARYGATDQFSGAIRSLEGTFHEIPYQSRVLFLPPNLLRTEFQIVGAPQPQTLIFDGSSCFERTQDGERDLSAPEKRTLIHQAFDESVFWLSILRDPNMIVEILPDGEFEGIEVSSIRVNHRYGYLRTLHFNRETLDLIAMEGSAPTEFGRSHEVIVWSDYEDVEGIRVPTHFSRRLDGAVVADADQTVSFTDLPGPESFHHIPNHQG